MEVLWISSLPPPSAWVRWFVRRLENQPKGHSCDPHRCDRCDGRCDHNLLNEFTSGHLVIDRSAYLRRYESNEGEQSDDEEETPEPWPSIAVTNVGDCRAIWKGEQDGENGKRNAENCHGACSYLPVDLKS